MSRATAIAAVLLLAAPAAHADARIADCLSGAARQDDPLADIRCIEPLLEQFTVFSDAEKLSAEGGMMTGMDTIARDLRAEVDAASDPVRDALAALDGFYMRSLDHCAGPDPVRAAACRVITSGGRLLVLTQILRDHPAEGE